MSAHLLQTLRQPSLQRSCRTTRSEPSLLMLRGMRASVNAAVAACAVAACAVLLMSGAGCERAPAPKPPTPISPAAKNPRAPQSGATLPSAAPTGASPKGAAQASAEPANAAQASAGQEGTPKSASTSPAVRVSTATSDAKVIEVSGLVMPKPVAWQWQAPTVQFRALQYAVPTKAAGTSDAELVFSVFAAGDGGPMDMNVKRWISQFRAEDGSPAEAIIADSTVNGIAVKTIELAGLYQGMGQAAPRPGIRQLGAILRTADGTVFIRLVGPDATVESWRGEFDAMIAGVRPQS